jgi:hypothetical protein
MPEDFSLLCTRVRQLSGVLLRRDLEPRVRHWVYRRGSAGLDVYGDLLRRDPDELDAFLACVS